MSRHGRRWRRGHYNGSGQDHHGGERPPPPVRIVALGSSGAGKSATLAWLLGAPGLDACQAELCGLSECNLQQ